MPDKVTRFDGLLENNKEFIKNTASVREEVKKEVSTEDKREFIKGLATDEAKQKAYAKELIPRLNLYIYAQMIASEFFNMGTINAGDPMTYVLDYNIGQAPVYSMAVHGGVPQRTITQDGEVVQLFPYRISSPEEHMNKFSLYQGDISAPKKLEQRASEGLANKTDLDMWAILENGLTSTLKEDMAIEIDDRVKNFPTTNILDFGTEGALTLEVFKGIAEHFDRLGKKVRNIYIPSNRRSDLWDWLSIPSGYDDGSGVDADSVVPMALQEQIVRTGTVNQLFGYPVNLVPINILDGTPSSDNTEVYAWVNTDSASGEYRDVPNLSYTFRDEDAERVYFTANKGIVMFQAPYQVASYSRVTFDTN